MSPTVTGVLFRRGLNIVANEEFVDCAAARFFMRPEFDAASDSAQIVAELRAVLPAGATCGCLSWRRSAS